jgi:hypothetical protein
MAAIVRTCGTQPALTVGGVDDLIDRILPRG